MSKSNQKAPAFKSFKSGFKFSKYDAPVGVDEGFDGGEEMDSPPGKYEEMAFYSNGGGMKQAYAGA